MQFSFVVFGFTSNLAQLKIIPALYDLEKKGKLGKNVNIIGIGRKEINIKSFIYGVLHQENRHHLHKIDKKIEAKLASRITYFREDFEHKDEALYKRLQNISGNILYYLATYPDLYHKIFQSLKNNNLNFKKNNWVRIMIEKPISRKVNKMIGSYFNENQIFRVDHYLGKENLRKIYIRKINFKRIEKVEAYISENFGVGKRGVYYDVTGALLDVGQNHLLQMIVSIFAKSSNPKDREKIISKLSSKNNKILFGQYDGYLSEENVSSKSQTDTFFALKTEYKNIEILMTSGKYLKENIAGIKIYYTDGSKKDFILSPVKKLEKYDSYEKLILDAIKGDNTFFNSQKEVELSWKFIQKYQKKNKNLVVYKKGEDILNTQTFLGYME